jgi:hypothetical protein
MHRDPTRDLFIVLAACAAAVIAFFIFLGPAHAQPMPSLFSWPAYPACNGDEGPLQPLLGHACGEGSTEVAVSDPAQPYYLATTTTIVRPGAPQRTLTNYQHLAVSHDQTSDKDFINVPFYRLGATTGYVRRDQLSVVKGRDHQLVATESTVWSVQHLQGVSLRRRSTNGCHNHRDGSSVCVFDHPERLALSFVVTARHLPRANEVLLVENAGYPQRVVAHAERSTVATALGGAHRAVYHVVVPAPAVKDGGATLLDLRVPVKAGLSDQPSSTDVQLLVTRRDVALSGRVIRPSTTNVERSFAGPDFAPNQDDHFWVERTVTDFDTHGTAVASSMGGNALSLTPHYTEQFIGYQADGPPTWQDRLSLRWWSIPPSALRTSLKDGYTCVIERITHFGGGTFHNMPEVLTTRKVCS